MERVVLFLTATAFIAVRANIVIQVDFKRPTFITYNDRTEVIEGDAEVTCIPPELCLTDIQEDRIIVQTVPEVMRDLIETPKSFEDEPDRLQAASSESTTLSPWKIYKEEEKSKRKNRKKKNRKAKTTSTTTTTTTTTEEPWIEDNTIDLYDYDSAENKYNSEVHSSESAKRESEENLYANYDEETTIRNLSEENTASTTEWSFFG
ncbi:uncharacterized protein [Anabrus simplex]|uniref:uncharacterized protein n=1 Tax=Anabrus simplex TaxID=316456 RepID=UPI0035A31CA6